MSESRISYSFRNLWDPLILQVDLFNKDEGVAYELIGSNIPLKVF